MDTDGQVVLAGAGHAHLHVIANAAKLRDQGIEVTVIAPPRFIYSGLAAAIAAGSLPVERASVDVARLCARHRVNFIAGRVDGIEVPERRVRTDTGQVIDFSSVSFNVGSAPATFDIDVADEVTRIKPLDRLAALPRVLDGFGRDAPRIAIVGAGPSGVELGANLAIRFDRRARITVFDQEPAPLTWCIDGARQRLYRRLLERGVELQPSSHVTRVATDHLEVDGRTQPHDLVLLATGLRAAPIVEELGLGDARGIPTRATLQHVAHDSVFAVGDCAHFVPRPLPKLGVYGVRAGPVLLEALLAQHRGQPLPKFEPQEHALRIIDLGERRGLGMRGSWWAEGRAPWLLKRSIDERWLARYR